MKNPNGYGSVYKLTGNRRKPWGVRKTIGWDENRKQLYQPLGYYEKREDAMIALAEYNKNPYSIDTAGITFAEVYERWSERKYKTIKRLAYQKQFERSYGLCSELYGMRFVDVKAPHLQAVIDKSGKNPPVQEQIRKLFNQMFAYAMENDIVVKNYAEYIVIQKVEVKKEKEIFSTEEILALWKHADTPHVDMALIMIYTGMRPGELLKIETSKVYLKDRYMIGGIKTDAGIDRYIPINRKIIHLIERRLKTGSKYLIPGDDDEEMKYKHFYDHKWTMVMALIDSHHKPHECRHTCISMLDTAGANKVAIKKIVGHSLKGVTERVYTHKDIQELIKTIDMI
jgi:integrase